MPTPIYHITNINNLQSILQLGGLLSNNKLRQQQINYQNIAHINIQDRRALTPVPCAAGGCLHDKVSQK
ncbi:MAG: DarT ssDNA thymidine ADP-ribosyltransferase family protein [Gloeotrichia echinulata GP01]